MLKFNELTITRDGRAMVIDVAVRDMPYYRDKEGNPSVFVSDIYVISHRQYKDAGPYRLPHNHVFHVEMPKETELTSFRVGLTDREVCHLKEDMFIVIAEAKGMPRGDTPCGMDEAFVLGVVFYEEPVYHDLVTAACELRQSCEPPRWFIDRYLRLQAIKAAINAGQYMMACRLYEEFMKGKLLGQPTRQGCNCHG